MTPHERRSSYLSSSAADRSGDRPRHRLRGFLLREPDRHHQPGGRGLRWGWSGRHGGRWWLRGWRRRDGRHRGLRRHRRDSGGCWYRRDGRGRGQRRGDRRQRRAGGLQRSSLPGSEARGGRGQADGGRGLRQRGGAPSRGHRVPQPAAARRRLSEHRPGRQLQDGCGLHGCTERLLQGQLGLRGSWLWLQLRMHQGRGLRGRADLPVW
jgi:hypothetical protein